MKWNKELIKQVHELHLQGLNYQQIANEISDRVDEPVNRRYIRKIVIGEKNAITSRALGYLEPLKESGESQTKSINKDGSETSTIETVINSRRNLSPDDLLEIHHYDASVWEVKQSVSNHWSVISTENGKQFNFQSKIIVAPKTSITLSDVVETFNKSIKPITVQQVKSGSHNLIIPIFDAHFGWATYEYMADYLQQILEIIERGYDNIEIIIGGDYFHSNYMSKSMTANGTQLDHVNNKNALDDGTLFISELIETAIKNSNSVKLHAIPGNHDADKQFVWVYGLKFKYPQLEIINSERKRDCFTLGKVGVMLAHGDLALKRLPMLFATEYSKIWADSKYRVIFTGHFHQMKITDDNGVVIYQCGTAKPSDPYEDSNGFTLSRNKMQVLEFNDERLTATYEVE